jgi:hypothetical protein
MAYNAKNIWVGSPPQSEEEGRMNNIESASVSSETYREANPHLNLAVDDVAELRARVSELEKRLEPQALAEAIARAVHRNLNGCRSVVAP